MGIIVNVKITLKNYVMIYVSTTDKQPHSQTIFQCKNRADTQLPRQDTDLLRLKEVLLDSDRGEMSVARRNLNPMQGLLPSWLQPTLRCPEMQIARMLFTFPVVKSRHQITIETRHTEA